MQIEIAHAEKFPYELGSIPRNARKACLRFQDSVAKREIVPDLVSPPKIKRMSNYKNLWRLKVSDDYRLIYRYENENKLLTMLMVDHRSKIYDRLGSDSDGNPGIRIVASAEELLEQTPTPDEVGNAEIELASKGEYSKLTSPEDLLPCPLDQAILYELKIPPEYFERLYKIETEGDLLYAKDIPDDVKERIMDFYWPSNIEDIVQMPVRVAFNQLALEEASEGKRKIESFLLKLDQEQQEFVTRFSSDSRPVGPWLLKGGPGSGKSTVTLYCIRSLLYSLHQLSLFEKDRPLRILYTTFTNSLVKLSEHLLNLLEVHADHHRIEVRTVDSLAYSFAANQYRQFQPGGKNLFDLMSQAIDGLRKSDKSFSFGNEDRRFLLEELDWVIIGQDIHNIDEYLDTDRSGRGRQLGRQQRKHLWLLYEKYLELVHENEQCLFSEILRDAAKSVIPTYDYIFIDEAQDLKPVAIRFLMGLCKNRKNIYLTADINQSIWGYSFSWTKMASDLKVQGRTRILRRNYRTTKEIWEGVKQIAPDNETVDQETLSAEAVYSGQSPVLAFHSTNNQIEERLNRFLFEALRQERAAPGSAAILCPTHKEIEMVMNIIDSNFNPKVMQSKEVDISWPGVKILTMHAAKGLEFPVVAVVGVEKGRLPLPYSAGADKEEHYAQQKRLFFVACSRAMRRLIVFANRDRRSPFIDGLTDEYWEIEEL